MFDVSRSCASESSYQGKEEALKTLQLPLELTWSASGHLLEMQQLGWTRTDLWNNRALSGRVVNPQPER